MPNGQWYPPEWPERIRALAAGEITAVVPRRAATVMLLRDDPAGPAVHLLRRRASMAFAAGAYVYPGGGVDPRDDDRLIGWAGPDQDVWARRLGVDAGSAQAIVCAAARETFEETGVLLAGESGESVVTDVTGDDWEADRLALVERGLSFADFLRRRGLLLRSDLLGAWARWITPEFEPRRYDTWFFVAALPTGQRTRNASTEADRVVWIRPAEAIAEYDKGELLMMPPTVSTLRTLAPHASAAEALAASEGRDLTPVLATARLVAGELELSWPGHDEFTKRVTPAGPAGPSGPADPAGPAAGPPGPTASAAPADSMGSGPMESQPMDSHPVPSELMEAEPMESGSVESGRMESGSMESESVQPRSHTPGPNSPGPNSPGPESPGAGTRGSRARGDTGPGPAPRASGGSR